MIPSKPAFSKAWFTSSAVTSFLNQQLNQRAIHSLLVHVMPCRVIYLLITGNTSFKAFAAPVEVGIMLSLHERARLKSLCGLSIFFGHL